MDDTDEQLEKVLRAAATRAIDYRRSVGDRMQAPVAGYQEACEAFDDPTPEHGSEAFEVIAELAATAEPGLHAMTGPRFFGWVIGASHPVGVAADWLTSAWGQNSGNHQATPAAAAAEETSIKWMLDILDLPRQSSVGFVTGATIANFVCLAAARGEVLRRVGWDVEADGLFGAPAVHVLIGADAHTTVFSALQFLGLGRNRVTRVPTDEAGRMSVEAFASAAGSHSGPSIAIAQAGQINTGAFDRFPELVEIARERGAWLHVDGAFGIWARACPDRAFLTAGSERADSWAVDGHKWLQTPYDCGYAIVRDADAHRRAMTITASYLPDLAAGERNPSHYAPELSRRARGFATWAMIRHLGRRGIADMVARHCDIARRMAQQLTEEPGVAVLNDVVLNQVIVRFGCDEPLERGDQLTKLVIDRIQADGVCFAGGAKWRGRWVMRLSVISWPTSQDDGDKSVEAILNGWRKIREN